MRSMRVGSVRVRESMGGRAGHAAAGDTASPVGLTNTQKAVGISVGLGLMDSHDGSQ